MPVLVSLSRFFSLAYLLASWTLQGELWRKLYFKCFVEWHLSQRKEILPFLSVANTFSKVIWKSSLKDTTIQGVCKIED